MVFNPATFEKRINGIRTYRNEPDAVLLRLGHPVLRRAVHEILGRVHNEDTRRWTLGRSELPPGVEGVLILHVELEYAETLLESELFGHAKGAYTGADRERRGALESAEGGTLFLDEVADLSPRLQSLFLRVLQEKEVRRVGSDRIHRVDARFLAATHRPLEQLAASGLFRKDLLFRLKGTVLILPSLRDRRHEFPYLVPRLVSLVARDLINPGSVGQPRDRDPRLAFMAYDPKRKRLKLHRMEYDHAGAAEAILSAGLHPNLAERLYHGN